MKHALPTIQPTNSIKANMEQTQTQNISYI